ncbi:MAG: hypothetical protein AABO58_08160 [Acidobacteriota bacterium]
MKYVLAAVLLTIAAIAFPDFRTAMQRSNEKQTMAAMRDIATVWEARSETSHRYAVEDLKDMPRLDGWDNPMELTASGNEYRIRSYGSDDRRDVKLIEGSHTDFARDIVYANGAFVAYPEGI